MLVAQGKTAVQNSLLGRIADARNQSDALFDIVRTEAIYDRPIPERHRIIFYVGHLEAFDWNLLHENVFGLKSFDPEFDRLFAFGIDPVGGGLPTDQPSDWPRSNQVRNMCARSEPRSMRNSRRLFSIRRGDARRLFARNPAECRHRAPLDACRNLGVHASPVAAGSEGRNKTNQHFAYSPVAHG